MTDSVKEEFWPRIHADKTGSELDP